MIQMKTSCSVPARLGLRGLRLCQTSGQAKAVNHSLALAWPGLGPNFIDQFYIYHYTNYFLGYLIYCQT